MKYEAKVTITTTTEYNIVIADRFEALTAQALAAAKPENLNKSTSIFEILILPIPNVDLHIMDERKDT